jgi:hypothetical protein
MADLEGDNLQRVEIWNAWILSFRHLAFLQNFLYFLSLKCNYLTISSIPKIGNTWTNAYWVLVSRY